MTQKSYSGTGVSARAEEKMVRFLEFLSLGLVSVCLRWEGVQCDLTLYRISVPATVSVPEGLCVVIPCNFTYDMKDAAGNSPFYGYWYEDKKIPSSDPAVATNDPRKTIEEYARDRFNLSVEVGHGNCSLLILDARKMDDERQYFFRMDKDKAKFSYMHIKPRVEVTSLENPQIQISGTFQAGHEANLTCVAPESCFAKRPHVSWEWEGLSRQVKSGIPLPRVNNFRDHISVLIFIPSAADHGQELTCQVTYGEGPNSLHRNETVRLNVTYKPQKLRTSARVMRSNKNFQNYTGASPIPIEKGDNVVLRCEADGNPWPHVTWTKTSPSSQVVQLASGDELRLWNLTMPDVGEYRCRAENSEGFDSASFRLSNAEPASDAWSQKVINGVIIGLSVVGVLMLIVASAVVFRKYRRGGKTVTDVEPDARQKTVPSKSPPVAKEHNSVGPKPEEDEDGYETEDKMEEDTGNVYCDPEEMHYATIIFNPQQPPAEVTSEDPTEYAEIKRSRPSDFSGDQGDIKGFTVV